mgnify:CR=1 FL=1
MANTITHKRSSTSSETPSASDLSAGEIALNTADAKLFIKKSDNSIATFVSSGMPTTGGTFTGDVTFTGDNYNLVWDKSDNALEFAQDSILKFGDDTEIENFSNNNTVITQLDGHFSITSKGSQKSVFIYGEDGTSSNTVVAYLKANGATGGVELFNYGNEKFRTQSTGVKITGELDFGNLSNNDPSLIRLGNDATSFGFNIKYMGSRSGVNNSLSIFTDNQQGGEASLEAFTMRQDGHVGILNTDPTHELTVTGDIEATDDIVVGDDLFLLSDVSRILFGVNNDVILTHVHDTGLLLNSTRQLQFGNSGTYIHQSADGVLDLVSDTEIEINATTIDMNGNLDVSGTITSGGVITGTGFTIGNAVITEAELEILDGASLTTTELNYVDGVTSAIQTQLDTKATKGFATAMAIALWIGEYYGTRFWKR